RAYYLPVSLSRHSYSTLPASRFHTFPLMEASKLRDFPWPWWFIPEAPTAAANKRHRAYRQEVMAFLRALTWHCEWATSIPGPFILEAVRQFGCFQVPDFDHDPFFSFPVAPLALNAHLPSQALPIRPCTRQLLCRLKHRPKFSHPRRLGGNAV